MIPDLQNVAGRAFRQRIDYLCGHKCSGLHGSIDEKICKAIQIIYEDLSDDAWPRFYLVQQIFKSRAKFLGNERFKGFLKDYEPFSNDFIEEMAWDSKMWEWRSANRNRNSGSRGRGRGNSSLGKWPTSYCKTSISLKCLLASQ